MNSGVRLKIEIQVSRVYNLRIDHEPGVTVAALISLGAIIGIQLYSSGTGKQQEMIDYLTRGLGRNGRGVWISPGEYG